MIQTRSTSALDRPQKARSFGPLVWLAGAAVVSLGLWGLIALAVVTFLH